MIYIEDNLPNLRENGLNTLENVNIAGSLTVTGTTTIAGLTLTDLTTTGNTTLGNAVSDTTTVNGVLTVTATATGNGIVDTGGLALKSATAVPATAGAVAAGAPLTLFTSGPSVYVTSDAPTHAAVKGSLCINTAGSTSSTRLYVSDGGTTWIAVTTAS